MHLTLTEEQAAARTAARRDDWLERAAMGASLLCLVHCLALPLAIAALPALSSVIHLPEDVHLWLLLLVVPATSAALLTGWRRHRVAWPLRLGLVGLTLVAAGALLMLGTHWETPATVAGSLIVAAAHLANWRLRHRAAPCACGQGC